MLSIYIKRGLTFILFSYFNVPGARGAGSRTENQTRLDAFPSEDSHGLALTTAIHTNAALQVFTADRNFELFFGREKIICRHP